MLMLDTMNYRTSRAVLVVVALAVGVSSCHPSPTRPSEANVAGGWSGSTCPPSDIDSCKIVLTIMQSDATLTGTYGTTSGNGTLSGTIVSSTVSMAMTPINPSNAEKWSITATVDGNKMTGTALGRAISLSRQP